ncbi:MAG: NADH-quinone oxidoreductase subunit L [Candidatus Kapabacteria bacterium]|jgi:NADH-quinone oxidoreductase subunit L|nr:NADH-quinone oxidoreductase subunit L [Candidatus Kapabacteria bacterium]
MASETLLQLSTVVLLLPLLSFVILIFFGKKIGRPSGVIGTSILGLNLVLSGIIAFQKLAVHADTVLIQTKFTWFNIGDFPFQVGFGVDNIAAVMLIVVNLISFLVHLFSTVYMEGDKRYPRFYAYLGIFTFSMLGIVLANNILFMYVFWELVGLSSYLLIGFWYEKDSAANASKKAFITNRIGDLGFLAGMLMLFFSYNTFMFDEIFAQIGMGIMPMADFSANGELMLTLAGIFIFMGAIGKSAQFPLHVWLPDAMEGPTPVSALIHAATMVAAGVYLVARVFPMLSADALTFIAYTGGFTAFMAATIAITQKDFKKVLAYSTVSQLGYMIMALGVGAYTYGFFHLVSHAWFKGALFLASGSVIHAMHVAMHHAHNHSMDAQDINNMGGLRKTMPKTYITFLLMTLAISGVPLTSGFLSKDGILAGTLAYAQLTGGVNWLIPLFGFGAAGMTAFYMFRLLIVSFHGKPKTDIAAHTKENKIPIVLPLFVLSILTLWIVYSPNPTDASSGWFYKSMKAPATVVPAEYQHDFLMPINKDNGYALAAHETVVENHAVEEALAHNDIPELEGEHAVEGDVVHDAAHAHDAEHSHEGEHAHEAADTHDDGHSHDVANTHDDGQGHEADAHQEHGNNHYANKFEEQIHKAHLPAMILSILIAGFGIVLAFVIYQFKIISADKLEANFKRLHTISYNKWYFDEIYHATFIGITVWLSKIMALFDGKVIDGIVNATAVVTRGFSYFIGHFDNKVIDGLVNLTASATGFGGIVLRKFQTGRVQT